MLKLVKYEYRRNLVGIVIMLCLVLGLEGYFLGATWFDNPEHVMIASAMLFVSAIVCVMGLLIYSVALYSRELNAKSSYLTFMTPNSATKILGAKLLATLLLGTGFAALFVLLGSLDFSLVLNVYPEIELSRVLISQALLSATSMELAELLTIVGVFVLEFLINFFTVVVIAYLAITLSATAFQNKKFKGIVSAVIFFAVLYGLQWGVNQIEVSRTYERVYDALFSAWPRHLVFLGAMLASFGLSAWLLEKKVSL